VATKDVRGVPGLVHRSIADAAWCVSVGVAEPHQYAGFSGGHKGVAIGCGGRATIAALHARDRVMDPACASARSKAIRSARSSTSSARLRAVSWRSCGYRLRRCGSPASRAP
jgi:nickel-dependent lactate racemase